MYNPPKLDASMGQDTELSRMAYKIILKWIGYSRDKFHVWDVRSDCGYFFDGAYYYGADQCYTALAYAVAVKLGEYDENITGLKRTRAKEMVIKTIRYLCFTHDTGPKDCVRVVGKNPLTSGKKWGGEGEDFFKATQVGNSLMNLGLASWLLWDDIDEETRGMLFNVFTSYADKWSGERPRNGVYMDTQAEENGWTAAGITPAAILFGEHPRACIWSEGVLKWALNCASVTDDWIRKDDVWEKPLNSRVFTVTFHPDRTAENHRFVHPNYMGAPIEHTGIISLYTRLAKIEDFPMITRNIEDIYNRTHRIWTGVDGSPVPVQSQDWWYYNTPRAAGVNAYMNVLYSNKDASYLERLSLDIVTRIQDGNGNGCIYEREPEKCLVSAGYQDIGDMEHRAASHMALIYLLHYFSGNGITSKTEAEFYEDIKGVYHYPHGGIIVKQSKESLACFSLRNSVMAATMPNDKLFTVTVPPSSTFGYIKVKGIEDKTGFNLAGSQSIFKIVDENVNIYDQGFGVSGKISRGSGEVIQNVGFAALPNNNTVYFERIDVLEDVDIEEIRTGLVGIRNDNKEGVPEYLKGYRDVVIFNDKRKEYRFFGKYGQDRDVSTRWENVTGINLDDRISYILNRPSSVEYISHRYYPKWKGVEDFLILNSLYEDKFLSAGIEIPPFIMLSVPNCSADETEDIYFKTCKTSDDNLMAVIEDEYLVYVNLAGSLSDASVEYEISKEIRIYRGHTKVSDGRAYWTHHIKEKECGFIEPYGTITIESEKRDFEIFAAGNNSICLRNNGDLLSVIYNEKRIDMVHNETINI